MMNANWSERQNLVRILATTAVGLLVWIIGLGAIWLLLQARGYLTDFWTMTSALSAAVTAAAVLGAGYAAYRQLAEVASARHIEVADRLFQELNSPQNIEARRWIFQNLPDDPDPEKDIPLLTSEGREAVKQVLNSLDHVAFLTQENWIPNEMIMPWMNPMIVKAWAKLEPYVDYESQRRHEPDYYEHARELAQRCRGWRAENLPDAKITWLDDSL
jgi:hypothetical protein